MHDLSVFGVPVAAVASKSLIEGSSWSLLLFFLRSRFIWYPPFSLLLLPLLSFLCCLDPGLSKTAPPFLFFTLFRFPVYVVWIPAYLGPASFKFHALVNRSSTFLFWGARFECFWCPGSQKLLLLNQFHPSMSFLYVCSHCFIFCAV